jgi:ssDNA-binding Zn-finger/Zn-ribbon topoisomerase 1
MTRTVERLDPYRDGQSCPVCGWLTWVVVGDKGKYWLVCTNGNCVGRRDLPDDVVVIDPEGDD